MPLCLVLNFFPPQDPKSKSKCLLGGSSPLVLYVASCNCVCRSSMLSRSVARVIISSLLAISLLKACEEPLSRQQMGSIQQQDVRLGQHGGCYRHRASRASDHFRTQCLLLDHHLDSLKADKYRSSRLNILGVSSFLYLPFLHLIRIF